MAIHHPHYYKKDSSSSASEVDTESESENIYENEIVEGKNMKKVEPLYHIPSANPQPNKKIGGNRVPVPQVDIPEKIYPKPTAEELDEFKGQVDEWVRLEDQIRKLNIAKRERMLRLRALGTTVQNFMTQFGYEHINRKDGSHIKFQVREVKKPVTLQQVKTQLLAVDFKGLTPEKLLDELFNSDSREKITKKSLKRIIPKVSSALDL